MKKVTIDVTKHYASQNPHCLASLDDEKNGNYSGMMDDGDGNRCCLGHIGHQLFKFPTEKLKHRSMPDSVPGWPQDNQGDLFVEFQDGAKLETTDLSDHLADINDQGKKEHRGLSYEQRCKLIKDKLAKHGIEVTFDYANVPNKPATTE